MRSSYTHLGLKGAIQANDEGVVREAHDVPLGEHLLDLVAKEQVVLANLLQREPALGTALANQVDGAGKEASWRPFGHGVAKTERDLNFPWSLDYLYFWRQVTLERENEVTSKASRGNSLFVRFADKIARLHRIKLTQNT